MAVGEHGQAADEEQIDGVAGVFGVFPQHGTQVIKREHARTQGLP
jgi:hypothetical protein